MYARIRQLEKCRRVLGEKVKCFLLPFLSLSSTQVADHEQRRRYVDALLDQFSAAISPSVVRALNERHVDDTLYFATMLCALNRHSTLDQYYRLCIKVLCVFLLFLNTETFQNSLQECLGVALKAADDRSDAVRLLDEWHASILQLSTTHVCPP